MRILAIDFGTSRIKAAIWNEIKQEAIPLRIGNGGRLFVPSLFHINSKGHICFGETAEKMLHHDPLGVLDCVKLELDRRLHCLPNGAKVKSIDLLAMVFNGLMKFSAKRVAVFNGQLPDKLVLTLPPTRYGYETLYKEAVEQTGFTGAVECIKEPEAAARAWMHEYSPEPGSLLVVLDFGGGTVDWACVRIDEEHRLEMVTECPPDGLMAAGVHVDKGLFDSMMNSLSDELKRYALDHRVLVMDQIRQMKESQNDSDLLSGLGGSRLDIQLGEKVFNFDEKEFNRIVKNEVLDKSIDCSASFLNKVAKKIDPDQVSILLVGGSRALVGLEEKIKQALNRVATELSIAVEFPELESPDFATVRGAVICNTLRRNTNINPIPSDNPRIRKSFF